MQSEKAETVTAQKGKVIFHARSVGASVLGVMQWHTLPNTHVMLNTQEYGVSMAQWYPEQDLFCPCIKWLKNGAMFRENYF